MGNESKLFAYGHIYMTLVSTYVMMNMSQMTHVRMMQYKCYDQFAPALDSEPPSCPPERRLS